MTVTRQPTLKLLPIVALSLVLPSCALLPERSPIGREAVELAHLENWEDVNALGRIFEVRFVEFRRSGDDAEGACNALYNSRRYNEIEYRAAPDVRGSWSFISVKLMRRVDCKGNDLREIQIQAGEPTSGSCNEIEALGSAFSKTERQTIFHAGSSTGRGVIDALPSTYVSISSDSWKPGAYSQSSKGWGFPDCINSMMAIAHYQIMRGGTAPF